MAESTGTATGLEDLLTKLLTFAVTQGWTQNEAVNTFDSGRQLALSKGTCFVQMRWDTAAPNTIALYQSTGYVAATRAGLQAGDSGNGFNSSNSTTEPNLEGERCIQDFGNTAIPSYHFYSNTSGDYIHAVVEVNSEEFRHFGFGVDIDKFGDWDTMTGGAYCYGHYNTVATSGVLQNMSILFDGFALTASGSGDMRDRGATIRLAGAPGQAGAGVWGHIWGNKTSTEFVDSAGNPRAKCFGGARGGLLARAFGWIPAGLTSGLAPLHRINLLYMNETPEPEHVYLLGFLKAVTFSHMRYTAPKDTFTLGSDTWRVFPNVRRAEGTSPGDTDFQGFAYLTNDIT